MPKLIIEYGDKKYDLTSRVTGLALWFHGRVMIVCAGGVVQNGTVGRTGRNDRIFEISNLQLNR